MTAERSARRPPRYQTAGFFMVRAPVLPAASFRRLTGTPAERLSLLGEPLAAAAIAAASTELYRSLSAPGTRAARDDPSDRISRSLFRYLNRMITRPTPFGLFAGVGTGRFADATSLHLDHEALERITISPDMAWLEALLRAADEARMARGQVPLTANDSVLESGGRLVHTLAGAGGGATGGKAAGDTVSIRATAVVTEVLTLARCPTPAATLAERMAERHRGAAPERIRGLIDELLRLDFLRADAVPPDGLPRPLAGRLDSIGRELRELAGLRPARLSAASLLDLAQRQRELTPDHAGSTFQLDASLALRGNGLSHRVGEAVADAVSALASVTGSANRSLRDYAHAFLERYGPGEEVPVLELLDPHVGLGAPRGYRWPAPEFPPPETARDGSRPREQLLLSWIQEATLDGGPVTLTDERVRQLSGNGPLRPPPPLLDAYVQVHAESPEAIDRGDWLAVIAPMGIVPGGRSFGRFARLLSPDAGERLGAFLDSENRLDPGPVFAELSYRPGEARMRNVSGHTGQRRYEIPVDIAPSVTGDHVLGLGDLLIGIHEDGQFFVRSRRLGRTVVAVQSHMLSPVLAPNVCRFLLEVSADRYHSLWSLREPVFARLPYCPRIVRGKVVIVPARWNLTRGLLGEAAPGNTALGKTALVNADGDASFAAAVGRWRARFRVPRHVYLLSHDDDQRLLLDLADGASLAELRRAIGQLSGDPHGSRHFQGLQEVLPGFGGLWLRDTAGDGRFCELVIPLALTRPPEGMPQAGPPTAASHANPEAETGRLAGPGGQWTQVRLYAAADRHDQLIVEAASRAGELIAGGQAASWFFIRYADPEPHIRLRLLAAVPESSAEIRESTVAWARGLAERSAVREFSVDTYRREVGRYGGPAGLAWCERIFHADSVGVSRVLAAAPRRPADEPEVAAAFTLDRLLSALGLDDKAKLELGYLRRVSSRPAAGHRQRRIRLLALLRGAREAGPACSRNCTARWPRCARSPRPPSRRRWS